MRRAILVIGKAPVPGATKTRLAPPLTPEGAATLYAGFLKDTLELAQRLSWEQTTLIHPRGHGPGLRGLPTDVRLLEQPRSGLADALRYAFEQHFAEGCESAILIGSDNPTLPLTPILAAQAALQGPDDVTLGPTTDGGYYLIGMRQPRLALFEAIDWSTSRVFAQTLERASHAGLRTHTVDEWYDVDEPADLERLRFELHHLPRGVARHTRAVLATLAPAAEAFGPIARRTPA